jgi:3-hydroxymyristoyl/3-hydroxydecanoyl-(acyl carrier protein) dehydratase
MQKRHESTQPPPPPAPTGAPAAAPAAMPLLAHHERLTEAHANFVRLQEQMHKEFLAHRERLLEMFEQHGAPPPAAPELPAMHLPPLRTPPPPVAAAPARPAPTTFSTNVTWEHALLDSHVLPVGALLAPLVRAGAGLLDVELEALGGLPLAGESLKGELFVGAADAAGKTEVEMTYRSADGARSILRISGHRLQQAALPPSASASLAAPSADPAGKEWSTKRTFPERDVDALLAGDSYGCFGAGFERAAAHTRTAPLPGAALVRLATVDLLDPRGGPRGLGAVRARTAADTPESPAAADAGLRVTRLYQGAQQVLAFFLAAAGRSVARDGGRFEAPAGHVARLRFGDAPDVETPLDYELLVETFDAPTRTVVGDVKAWAGDKLVFHGERVALRVVQDYPLSSDRDLQADAVRDDARNLPTADIDGFKLGYSSMMAGALGWPKAAFNQAGDFFERTDRQMPRLPGPPYHFVTRVSHVAGERLSMKPGAEATMEYDVPVDAWYFDENGNRTMPWCVLLEAALQPCGWLSVYVGCPLAAQEDVFFRNLDGAGAMVGEVFGGDVVRTHTKVTSVANVAGVMLISYKIECTVGDRVVCKLTAAFGYFPNEALDAQVGLPMLPEHRARFAREANVDVDLRGRPEKFYRGALRLPGPMLLMVDRITGHWPGAQEGDKPGYKARLRSEKTVNPRDWFFKSHFFRDPVQPGSLGVEMMLQTLQYYVIEEGLAAGVAQPYFEPLALSNHVSWKFRGQVRPENKRIVADMEVVSVEATADGVTVIANGSLWVDGVRCYEAKGLGMRVRGGRPVAALPPRVVDAVLDPAIDKWVSDHRPSYTVPVMPGMSMVDRLASAAIAHVREAYPAQIGTPDWGVIGVQEFRAHGWLVADRPRKLRTEVDLAAARAVHRSVDVEAAASMFDLTDEAARKVATGKIRLARRWGAPPPAWEPLADAAVARSPYDAGSIFWGPRLQLLRRLALGRRGATAQLDAAGADAPIGAVHHILLDGALHAIPHDELDRWSDKIAPGYMGVPVRLTARFFGPPPRQGMMRAEIRFAGFDGASALPAFAIQIIDPSGRVWAVLRHVEMLVPLTHQWKREHRVPFLVERKFVEGAGLSRALGDRSELLAADVKRMDSLPGSVAYAYGLPRDATVDPRVVAIKDHVGQRARVHPARVEVDASLSFASAEGSPEKRYPVSVAVEGEAIVVRDAV